MVVIPTTRPTREREGIGSNRIRPANTTSDNETDRNALSQTPLWEKLLAREKEDMGPSAIFETTDGQARDDQALPNTFG